jgi:hypothetical protein
MSSAEKPGFVSIDEYLRGESVSILKHEYIDGCAGHDRQLARRRVSFEKLRFGT